MTLRDRLEKLATRINTLETRERVLVLGATVAIVGGLLFALLLDPLQQQLALAQRQQLALDQQVAELGVQVDQLAARAAIDPDEESRQRLQQLREQIAVVDNDLREKTLEFISPAQMAQVVEDLVIRTRGLELVAVQSEPVQVVEDLVEPGAATEEEAPKVYRHGVTVELRGDYLAVLDYVQNLEALRWKIFWEGLELETDAYPVANVRLRIYTLSLRKGWIGV